MTRLQGRRAVVTGAANGQGHATALAFVREGADVVGLDIDESGLDELQRSAGGSGATITGIACDVGDESSVANAVDRATSTMGGIDILFNNAGLYLRGRGDGLSHELSLDVWTRTFRVNTVGMFLMTRAVIPAMMEAGRGSIINVSSIGGVIGSDCHAYSASKGAILAYTRSVALGYARSNIRANAIAQGVIRTNMSRALTENDSAGAQRYLEGTPLGRWGEVGEVAEVAVFLASEDSSYMTGATLNIDGGLSIRP